MFTRWQKDRPEHVAMGRAAVMLPSALWHTQLGIRDDVQEFGLVHGRHASHYTQACPQALLVIDGVQCQLLFRHRPAIGLGERPQQRRLVPMAFRVPQEDGISFRDGFWAVSQGKPAEGATHHHLDMAPTIPQRPNPDLWPRECLASACRVIDDCDGRLL